MPTIAIIGRPNVGKSTLFNSIIGERRSLESAQANTTRDRVLGVVEGSDLEMTFVDTAGISRLLSHGPTGEIEQTARDQALASLSSADMILFCLSTQEELTAEDREVADLLRRHRAAHIPLLIVGTKAEKQSSEMASYEWYELGLDAEIVLTSAKLRAGVADLIDTCESALLGAGHQSRPLADDPDAPLRLAVVGRPNAGKSTLVNALLGREEVIVSPQSGTTRDHIELPVRYEKETFLLLDTPGVRRKSQMNREELEKGSRLQAVAALQKCDIAILLVDITEGVTHQDQALMGIAEELGCGVVLALNKWDTLRDEVTTEHNRQMEEKALRRALAPLESVLHETESHDEDEVHDANVSDEDPSDTKALHHRIQYAHRRALSSAQQELSWLSWVPVVTLSALEKKGIQKILQTAQQVQSERHKRIPTSQLNVFLEECISRHPPATRSGKPLKIKYLTQVEISPPTFVMFLSGKEQSPHFSFLRYLKNQLRHHYGFWGTPLRVYARKNDPRDGRR